MRNAGPVFDLFFLSAHCQMWMSVKCFLECVSMASASTHQAPFSASALLEWLLMSVAGHALVRTILDWCHLSVWAPCVLVFLFCFCLIQHVNEMHNMYGYTACIYNYVSCDFQTCVRSSVTSPMKMNGVGLLSQGGIVWMPAAALWV